MPQVVVLTAVIPWTMEGSRVVSLFARMGVLGVSVCILGSTQGCSWLFVQPVPPGGSRGVVTCTSNRAAPVIDTIFTGTNIASALYVTTLNDGTDKGPAVMFGLSVAGLWLASAVYGYQHTAECEAEQEKYQDDYEPPRPRRRYRAAPPPRSAPPPAAPAPYEPPPPPAPAADAPAPVPGSPATPGSPDAAAPPAAAPTPAPPAKPAVPQRADDE